MNTSIDSHRTYLQLAVFFAIAPLIFFSAGPARPADPAGGRLSWGPSASLARPSDQGSSWAVAVSRDAGRATAIWCIDRPAGMSIRSSRYRGGSWRSATTIAPNAEYLSWTDVSESADGKVTAVTWEREDVGTERIQARLRIAGAWQPAVALSPDIGIPSSPQVVVTADGSGALVAWELIEGTSHTVYVSTWNGSGWSLPSRMSDVGVNARNPAVASDETGSRLTLAWEQEDAIVVRRGSMGGPWQPATTVSPATTKASAPSLAVAAEVDRAVVAYSTDNSDDEVGVGAATWDGTTWTPNEMLALSNEAFGVEVALAADGSRALVAWAEGIDDPYTAMSRMWNGSSWGPLKRLNRRSVSGSHPSVTVAANGKRATAAWTVYDRRRSPVQVRNWHLGSGWSRANDIPGRAIGSGGPEIASTGSGRRSVVVYGAASATFNRIKGTVMTIGRDSSE